MYKLTYTKNGGTYTNAWDNSSYSSEDVAILNSNKIPASGLAKLVDDVNVFNVIMQLDNLDVQVERFGGKLTLDIISLLACYGQNPTHQELGEMALAIDYQYFVTKKRNAAAAKLNTSILNWGFTTISEMGGFADACKKYLPNYDESEIEMALTVAKKRIPHGLPLDEVDLSQMIEARALTSLLLKENFEFPDTNQIQEEIHFWNNNLTMISSEENDSQENDFGDEYSSVNFSIQKFNLPEEGMVIIARNEDSSYCCD